MKILLAAFACNPLRGSEPGIGWNWAHELSVAGHSVWVITGEAGKEEIKAYLEAHPNPRLRFEYVAAPVSHWLPESLRYIAAAILWRSQSLSRARKLNEEIDFDIVHHVSFGSLHLGSSLWRLKKPFIFGPVGGGQVAPPGFSRYLVGGRLIEAVRSVVVRYLTGILFFARSTVANAAIVLYANEETRDWAQRLNARHCEYMSAAGVSHEWLSKREPGDAGTSKPLKILWLGGLRPRKGVLLALEALALLGRTDFECTIVGEGIQSRHMNAWIGERALTGKVDWQGHIPFTEVMEACTQHDVLLFTSLRDTDGNQLLEAMARGCAVVALDHQGAQSIVNETSGLLVPVTTPAAVVSGLAQALQSLAADRALLSRLSRGAVETASTHTWVAKARRASEIYESLADRT